MALFRVVTILLRVGTTLRNKGTGCCCGRGASDGGFAAIAFGFGAGFGSGTGGALAIAAAGCGMALGGAGRASGTRIALSGARPRRTAKPAPVETAAGS